jgi:MFS family permease
MSYPFFGVLAIVAAVIVVPTIAFLILALFEGFPRIRLGQIAGMVAVAAWIFGLYSAPGRWQAEIYLFWTVVGLLLTFFGLWKREMRLLMSRRDDEFPGGSDKRGWVLLLTLAAPAGVWIFRSYRKAQWRNTPAVRGQWPSPTKPRSSPWDDEVDALSPARAGVE